MTPSEVLRRFNSQELTEQMVFSRIEPLADDRVEFLLAQLTQMFLQSKMPKGKRIRPEQVRPWIKPRRQSPEEILRALKQSWR
jgi:hypothetical protein